MAKPENRLVEQAKAGSADAFGQLYAQYAQDLYRFAYYYLGSREEAEDAVQDVGNGVKDAVDGVEQGVSDMTNTAENAGKAMKRSVEEGGVSYGEMLDNARVHDTDGDLTDHENAVTPGWDG